MAELNTGLLTIKDDKIKENIRKAYSIRSFVRNCIYSENYHATDGISDVLKLTKKGNEIYQEVLEYSLKNIPGTTSSDIHFAMFLSFGTKDLFIDLETTDINKLQSLISEDIRQRRLMLPFLYDRLLYDKGLSLFDREFDSIDYEKTIELLTNTPQGVFQVEEFVSGPFGILISPSKRKIQPTAMVPLFHCSNPACESIHPCKLGSGKSVIPDIERKILDIIKLEKKFEWNEYYIKELTESNYFDLLHPGNLPWLLGNAFSEHELRNILSESICSRSSSIKQQLVETPYSNFLHGSPHELTKKLNKGETLQLLLLETNEHIVMTIENLIENKTIDIPWSETRTPKYSLSLRTAYKVNSEVSRLGVRFVPTVTNMATVRTRSIINELYSSKDDKAALEWALRHHPGKTANEKLEAITNKENPRELVKQLIMSNPDKLEKAFSILKYGNFRIPKNIHEEETIIDKILWKIGYDINSYPEEQRLLRERISQLRSAARKLKSYSESEREIVRSVGVNLFVSMEEFLETSLSFCCWLLLSDHLGTTRYKFNSGKARKILSSSLSNLRSIEGKPIIYSNAGKNTLFPLIQGYSILAEKCEDIIRNHANYVRHDSQIPSLYKRTSIVEFPFPHTVLVADLRPDIRNNILTTLRQLTYSLETSGIYNTRNGIDHKRDEFPTKDDICNTCGNIEEIIESIERCGLYPTYYSQKNTVIDEHDRGIITFEDYLQNEITITSPSQFASCNLPPQTINQILVPIVQIGDSTEIFRCTYEVDSDYIRMWDGYPKSRISITKSEDSGE